MPSDQSIVIRGVVSNAYANSRFQIKCDSGLDVLAHLAGRLVKHRIRVVVGDEVEVELSAYDLTRGRIVKRI